MKHWLQRSMPDMKQQALKQYQYLICILKAIDSNDKHADNGPFQLSSRVAIHYS